MNMILIHNSYTESYMSMLRLRNTIPLVEKDSKTGQERMILLKEEVGHEGANSKGRPIGPQYWDREEKIKFMDTHGIDVSVISLANPWLDFLSPSEAIKAAEQLNLDLQAYCSMSSTSSSATSTFEPLTSNRLFAFGSLPLVPGVGIEDVLNAIEQVKRLDKLRGIVMGTKGFGKGLDDEALEPVWRKLDESGLVVFVHPHYGIENAFGEKDNGHVLALGLGFPFETTIAITRLILSGVLDRHPSLKLLIAHSAGALPILSSRLSSCVLHDPEVKDRLHHDFRYYLGLLYYDAVAYGAEELAFVERCIARAETYEGTDEQLEFVDRVTSRKDLLKVGQRESSSDHYPGADRIMFGTDMPFFPPLSSSPSSSSTNSTTTMTNERAQVQAQRWKSVDENLDAITNVPAWSFEQREKILGTNAKDLFGLEL